MVIYFHRFFQAVAKHVDWRVIVSLTRMKIIEYVALMGAKDESISWDSKGAFKMF